MYGNKRLYRIELGKQNHTLQDKNRNKRDKTHMSINGFVTA